MGQTGGSSARLNSVVPVSPEEKQLFDEMLRTRPSVDPLLDWADTEIRNTFPPLFADGQVLSGRFQIVRFLGRGGMGEVYEARDLTLHGKAVALKALTAEIRSRSDAAKRFLNEVEFAHRVTHPNICRIHDVYSYSFPGRDGQELKANFLTMGLLEGPTLEEYLKKRGPISLHEARPILDALAGALGAAHSAGVIHRDFKPGNVIMVRRQGELQPVVTDFGLAAVIDNAPEASEDKRFAYTRAGTAGYAAPEQLEDGQASAASDIYSFGVVALRMLTGVDSLDQAPQLASHQQTAIRKCLAPHPGDRFPSAEAFIRALAGEEEPAAHSTGLSRRGILVRVGGVAVAGAAGASGWIWAHHPGVSSLAILPFQLADAHAAMPGLQEELVRSFLRARTPKLISPYTALTLKAPFDFRTLSQKLPAQAFLTGTLFDGKVAVSLRRPDGSQLWQVEIDRTRREVDVYRRVQEEVVGRIAGKTSPDPQFRPGYEASTPGFQAYVRGRAAFRGQAGVDLKSAEQYFREAIRHDSDYSAAFSGLAYALFLQNQTEQARELALRALALDPDSAEAHIVEGLIRHRCDWDWDGALSSLRKALDLEPYNPAAHHAYGGCVFDHGRFDEALSEVHEAVLADPLAYNSRIAYGIFLVHAHRFDAAVAELSKAVEVAGNDNVHVSRPYNYLGAALMRKGQFDRAFQYYSQALAIDPHSAVNMAHFVCGAAGTGHRDQARAKMHDLVALLPGSSSFFYTGVAYAALGDCERALNLIEQGIEKRDSDVVNLKTHLYVDPLRSDPRYRRLLDQMKLS